MKTLPVTSNHHNTNNFPDASIPGNDTPAHKRLSRLGSILGTILVFGGDSELDSTPITPSYSVPCYSAEHLSRLNASRVGMAFHVVNHKGDLMRRGVIVSESTYSYKVVYCDVFGILGDVKRVAKSQTTKWKWFAGIDESNHAYDRLIVGKC